MATTPSHLSPDCAALTAELKRIGDLLEARMPTGAPANAGEAAPVVTLKDGKAPIPLDSAGEKVFEALRAWRLSRARQDGLSPYIVAYDRSLRQIARERPTTVEALQAIPGFGGSKAGKYGPELFEVLAKA